MRGRRRLGAVVSCACALVVAASARADDCATLTAVRDAVALAQDEVDAALGAADVAAALVDARADVLAADAAIVAAVAPDSLTQRRRALRVRLRSAARWLRSASRRPANARRVGKFVLRADRALDRAAVLVGAAMEPVDCGEAPGGDPPGGVTLGGSLVGEQIFPADNWWNVDISARPVATDSAATIDFIGRDKPLHADFGTTFGIPYVVLDEAQPPTEITFGYDDESDHGAPGALPGYPIPVAARTTAGFVEGGVAGGGPSGDRHLILVDRTTHTLFEIFAARWTGSAWSGGSGAIFDLTSNARRPEGWTSADAAGLAIFPGLVRADEVFEVGEIRHALRFTVRATQGYVFPASHDATHGSGGDARPPLGLRVRLKQSADLSAMSAPARVVFTAMKTYGLILADNGSDWFVTGAPDARWDDERMHDDFARIRGGDFEVVE